MHAHWLTVSDPAAYARRVLHHEAPDIPELLVTEQVLKQVLRPGTRL